MPQELRGTEFSVHSQSYVPRMNILWIFPLSDIIQRQEYLEVFYQSTIVTVFI